MAVPQLVDGLAQERVLVVGSLPPAGRDLDLLVTPATSNAIATGLLREGFLRRANELVRFRECAADVVELVPAADWGLPPAELDAVLAAALPLDGCVRLVRPAPHHALLVLARRMSTDALSTDKLKSRVAAALAEDPQALTRARNRAAAWRADGALEVLTQIHEPGLRRVPRGRLHIASARGRTFGGRGGSAPRRAVRRLRAARRRGTLITFSGLDGAGKSSQCEALCETLRTLGYDSVVEWSRFAVHPAIDRVALPLKRLLGEPPSARRGVAPPPRVPSSLPQDDRARLSRRNPLVRFCWTTFVALANVASQRGATVRHLRGGRVVVCDRYTLDSLVHLQSEYGDHSFSVQRRLLKALSPKPALAYFLDVSPETALRRKPEQFALADLERHARQYRDQHAAVGARRLDGERARTELCAEVAAEAWARLSADAERSRAPRWGRHKRTAAS